MWNALIDIDIADIVNVNNEKLISPYDIDQKYCWFAAKSIYVREKCVLEPCIVCSVIWHIVQSWRGIDFDFSKVWQEWLLSLIIIVQGENKSHHKEPTIHTIINKAILSDDKV